MSRFPKTNRNEYLFILLFSLPFLEYRRNNNKVIISIKNLRQRFCNTEHAIMKAGPSRFQQALKCFADSLPTSVFSLTLGEQHKVPTAAEEERNHSVTFQPTSRVALL